MIRQNDAAVSPVVGVMLMLVVTIIIAAVVSAFAGGMGSEQHKTPQTTMIIQSVIESVGGTTAPSSPYTLTYPDGYTAANGLMFENTGGDTFSLNDIDIQLQYQDTKYTLRPDDKLSTTNILPVGISNGGYFQKIGNMSLSDRMIAPGDKFMVYADGNSQGVTYSSGGYYGPKLSWRPYGSDGGFSIYLKTKANYQIIDKVSSRAITTGEFIL